MRAAAIVAGALVVAIVGVWYAGREGQSQWVYWAARADSALERRPRASNKYPTFRTQPTKHPKRDQKVELNTADSAALVAVYGIGPVFAQRIIAYRTALGGFYRIEQLREVRGITEERFLQIENFFCIDSTQRSKINVNFVAPNVLQKHPYATKNMAQRLVEGRTKGGYYTSVENLLERDILLPQEAKRLAPYLLFTQTE